MLLRTKQYIADPEYNGWFLFFPKTVANRTFPSGLPTGPISCLRVLAHFDSAQSCSLLETWTGTAEKNPLPKDYQEHLARFIPVLQSYHMHDAATHFRQWLDGELPLAPLLDVSGPLGLQNYGV